MDAQTTRIFFALRRILPKKAACILIIALSFNEITAIQITNPTH